MIEIPNGVDTDRFQPASDGDGAPTTGDGTTDPDTRQTPSLETKMDGGRPTIIYTGNLGSSQALDCFVRAMTHLSHDSAVLRFVGSGDVESQLRDQAADLGVEDRVRFEGVVPREEIPGLLTEATIGIAPILDSDEMAYAMPTKLYEYMASGLPTVVTGRGEIEQFVERSGGGVHTDTDPEAIAATLDELLADREKRHRLGVNGREYITEHYDRKAIARDLGEELENLTGGEQPA
jgi:colanic acid biosynthesis glycosyl transferase WcaI